MKRAGRLLTAALAAGLAMSSPSLAASTKSDSVKGSGTLSQGSTFTLSATSQPDQPLTASGIWAAGQPGSPHAFAVTCLNVVDRKHAYLGLTDPESAGNTSVILLTVGRPDTLTDFTTNPDQSRVSDSQCADPSGLPTGNFTATVTSGGWSIVDA
jgi:PKD repeat protein